MNEQPIVPDLEEELAELERQAVIFDERGDETSRAIAMTIRTFGPAFARWRREAIGMGFAGTSILEALSMVIASETENSVEVLRDNPMIPMEVQRHVFLAALRSYMEEESCTDAEVNKTRAEVTSGQMQRFSAIIPLLSSSDALKRIYGRCQLEMHQAISRFYFGETQHKSDMLTGLCTIATVAGVEMALMIRTSEMGRAPADELEQMVHQITAGFAQVFIGGALGEEVETSMTASNEETADADVQTRH